MGVIKSGLTPKYSDVIGCRLLVLNAMPESRWFYLGYDIVSRRTIKNHAFHIILITFKLLNKNFLKIQIKNDKIL